MENFDGVMVERLKNGEWYYLYRNMEELRLRDVFRMWHLIDDKWVLHKDDRGFTEWVTMSRPYFENGVWNVACVRRKQ